VLFIHVSDIKGERGERGRERARERGGE